MTDEELMAVAPHFFAPQFEGPHAEKFRRFGPGWRPLVADMARQIAAVSPEAQSYCLKEKFGGLRCYFTAPDKDHAVVRAIVDEFEAISLTKCDVCGWPGSMVNDGRWMRVRCAKHRDSRWWE